MSGVLTAKQIEAALEEKYVLQQPGYAFLREVSIDDAVAVGHLNEFMEQYPDWRNRPEGEWERLTRQTAYYRRIDVLLMKTARTAKPVPYERIAVEIKVSRSDFLRDTEEKRRPWMTVAHRFVYAVPGGLIRKDEVPAGCGLIEVNFSGPGLVPEPEWTVRAPRRDHDPAAFDDAFVAYLAGRASRAEHELRKARRVAA